MAKNNWPENKNSRNQSKVKLIKAIIFIFLFSRVWVFNDLAYYFHEFYFPVRNLHCGGYYFVHNRLAVPLP